AGHKGSRGTRADPALSHSGRKAAPRRPTMDRDHRLSGRLQEQSIPGPSFPRAQQQQKTGATGSWASKITIVGRSSSPPSSFAVPKLDHQAPWGPDAFGESANSLGQW